MTTQAQAQPDTFGNFRAPKSYGYGQFGMITTMLGFGGALVGVLLAFLANVIAAAVFGVLWFAVLAGLSLKDQHGRSRIQKIGTKVAYRKARKAGHVDYLSGPITRHGSFRLPGLLATTELTEHMSSSGAPFALLHYPKQHHYVVAFLCEPDGASLLDPRDEEMQIARWSVFLESMAIEPDLRQVMVTIETVPDTGSNLRHAIEKRLDASSPPLAQQVMNKVAATYPTTSATTNSWVVLTYRSNGRTTEQVAADLRDQLPQVAQSLSVTGAGVPTLVDAQTYAQSIRVAYDPEVAHAIEDYEVPTVMRWADCGPAAAHAGWDHYRHDSGVSVTFGMSEGPQSNVSSKVLNALLEPHPDIPRKRVSIIYTPMDPAASVAAANKDVNSARARINTTKRPSERARKDLEAAQHTAAEEAGGAILTDFTILATVTVTEPDLLPKAKAALLRSAPVSRIRLRPFNGSQDSAFAMALPVGIVHEDVVSIPSGIREGF
jgi:hypothetical protein